MTYSQQCLKLARILLKFLVILFQPWWIFMNLLCLCFHLCLTSLQLPFYFTHLVIVFFHTLSNTSYAFSQHHVRLRLYLLCIIKSTNRYHWASTYVNYPIIYSIYTVFRFPFYCFLLMSIRIIFWTNLDSWKHLQHLHQFHHWKM